MTPNVKLAWLVVVAAGAPVDAAAAEEVVVVTAAPNWNVPPVVRGCTEAEALLLVVVAAADQLPKRDFGAIWAPG